MRYSPLLPALLVLAIPCAFLKAQYTVEARLDSSEAFTRIADQTGRFQKFIATSNRLVLMDYENFRILFYKRGASFTDPAWLKTVGVHSLPKDDAAYNPASQKRLNSEYSGTIWRDTLYVTNARFGEVLRFDLNGNFLDSKAGQFRVLLSDSLRLFGFSNDSVYVLNPSSRSFEFRGRIPGSVMISSERNGSNVRVGANRITVRKDTTVNVYVLADVLAGSAPSPLFTIHAKGVPDCEILPNRIIWGTGFGNPTPYATCDLNGVPSTTGQLALYLYNFNYTGNTLFAIGAFTEIMADTSLQVLSSVRRFPYYLSLNLLGADSTRLYFRDGGTGGLILGNLDLAKGQFLVSPHRLIPYAGYPFVFRNGSRYRYILDQFPTVDSASVMVFDTDSLTARKIRAYGSVGMDVLGDTILTLRGNRVTPYLPDGTQLPSVALQTVDTTGTVLFAASTNRIFYWSGGTVKFFRRSGTLDTSFALTAYSYSTLFGGATRLNCNYPVSSMALSDGKLTAIPGAATEGYFAGKLYWSLSGTNTYSAITPVLTAVAEAAPAEPAAFQLGQNYPNPFNPSTTLEVSTPQYAGVKKLRLAVYDMLGREVALLMNGEYAQGSYTVHFEAQGLATGTYLYRLEIEGSTMVRKMLLLK